MVASIHRVVIGPKELVIAANESDTDVVDVSSAEKAMVFVPVGWNGADLTFLAAAFSNSDRLDEDKVAEASEGLTFYPVCDESGTLLRISNIVAGRWYSLPAGALAVKYLKLRSTQVGGNDETNQADTRRLRLLTKS